MEWNEILECLKRARAKFLARDRYLLTKNANERSMTYKFAGYLQMEFPAWNVDCEYNRRGKRNKRLPPNPAGNLVRPDIIVHRQGEPNNLLVIEAKKSGSSDEGDKTRLRSFLNPDGYGYSHAVFIVFDTRGDGNITFSPVQFDPALTLAGIVRIPDVAGDSGS